MKILGLQQSFPSTLSRGVLTSLSLVLVLSACIPGFRPIAEDVEPLDPLEDLVLNDVTLEQSDSEGHTIWKLEAIRATYEDDRKVARVDKPVGFLFQNNEATYEVQATAGEVYEDGERVLLRDQVVVTHLPSKAVLQGDQLEWRPEQNVLVMQGNIKGSYEDLEFTAQAGQYQGRNQDSKQAEEITVEGNIVALLKDSNLRLKTDALIWQIPTETVVSDRPVLIERYDPQDPEKVVEWAKGEGLWVDIAKQRSTLEPNAKVSLSNPALDIASASLTWDALAERVETDQPVEIVHRSEQMTMRADRGAFDLVAKIVTLDGRVDGWNPKQQARLLAEHLKWTIPGKLVEANGNVVYSSQNPQVVISGDQAVGRLDAETLEVRDSQAVKTVYTLE